MTILINVPDIYHELICRLEPSTSSVWQQISAGWWSEWGSGRIYLEERSTNTQIEETGMIGPGIENRPSFKQSLI